MNVIGFLTARVLYDIGGIYSVPIISPCVGSGRTGFCGVSMDPVTEATGFTFDLFPRFFFPVNSSVNSIYFRALFFLVKRQDPLFVSVHVYVFFFN